MSAALALAASPPEAVALCYRTIALHSRSFAFASRLLPPAARASAAVVYAWCRRADDTVDLAATAGDAAAGLARLRAELEAVDAGRAGDDAVLAAFAQVVARHGVPRRWPEELLRGMEMDVRGHRYETWDDLLLYAFRVAGTVGLMMSHVMGVSDPRALRNASHLGIAMQLTNVCRDVAEDWDRGRLYLPRELLAAHGVGWLADRVGAGAPLPAKAGPGLRAAVAEALARADAYYRSGDAGLGALHWRCALAVRTARLVYAAIGARLARTGYDVLGGRAIVSGPRKLGYALLAAVRALAEAPRRWRRRFAPAPIPQGIHDDLVRL